MVKKADTTKAIAGHFQTRESISEFWSWKRCGAR
jgi:hypothetical protein